MNPNTNPNPNSNLQSVLDKAASTSVDDLIKQHNAQRKANKNRWLSLSAVISGHRVAIKSYNTWIQVLKVEGPLVNFRDSGPMDCSVKACRDYLAQALKPLIS